MTNHDDGGEWLRIFDATTTRQQLDRIIDAQVRIQLVDALRQIALMDLGPRDQATALVQLEPIIRERTAAALEAGWRQLQLDATNPQAIH